MLIPGFAYRQSQCLLDREGLVTIQLWSGRFVSFSHGRVLHAGGKLQLSFSVTLADIMGITGSIYIEDADVRR